MNISSMTGFARKSGKCEIDGTSYDWAFELKSVNGKNFDFKIRLPQSLDFLTAEFRTIAQKYFERGNISANFELLADENSSKVKINYNLLNMLIEASSNMAGVAKPSAGELLAINGVIEPDKKFFDDEQIARLQVLILSDFEKCCADLKADREVEGQKIALILGQMLDNISLIVEKIASSSLNTPQQISDKIKRQIADFLGENSSVSEERLAQEIVFYVNRADIREEIDRLRTHIDTARHLLDGNKSVGRRMDFLCQELNREANTTCSKAVDIEIINAGMELKAAIEQLREQVQNME